MAFLSNLYGIATNTNVLYNQTDEWDPRESGFAFVAERGL